MSFWKDKENLIVFEDGKISDLSRTDSLINLKEVKIDKKGIKLTVKKESEKDDNSLNSRSSPLSIFIVYLGKNKIMNEIKLEKNSQLTIFEISEGENNVETEFDLEDNSNLSHAKIFLGIQESKMETDVDLEKEANYESFVLNLRSNSKNELKVELEGENSRALTNGLTILKEKQAVENKINVEHEKEFTSCDQLYKSILDDESRSTFDGMIFVDKKAQKTNSSQLSKNLLLSKKAKAITKPQLEINADDVKCNHGATVGQLRDEELFYLKSRGLNEDAARRMLVSSFAREPLEKIKNEALKETIGEILLGEGL